MHCTATKGGTRNSTERPGARSARTSASSRHAMATAARSAAAVAPVDRARSSACTTSSSTRCQEVPRPHRAARRLHDRRRWCRRLDGAAQVVVRRLQLGRGVPGGGGELAIPDPYGRGRERGQVGRDAHRRSVVGRASVCRCCAAPDRGARPTRRHSTPGQHRFRAPLLGRKGGDPVGDGGSLGGQRRGGAAGIDLTARHRSTLSPRTDALDGGALQGTRRSSAPPAGPARRRSTNDAARPSGCTAEYRSSLPVGSRPRNGGAAGSCPGRPTNRYPRRCTK